MKTAKEWTLEWRRRYDERLGLEGVSANEHLGEEVLNEIVNEIQEDVIYKVMSLIDKKLQTIKPPWSRLKIRVYGAICLTVGTIGGGAFTYWAMVQ